MSSSWSCSRCTFLNPPSQKLTCQICLSPSTATFKAAGCSSSSVSTHSAGRWTCLACTYMNPHGSMFCEVCDTRAAPFSRLPDSDLEKDDLTASDPSIGSVFLPLQRCGSKRPANGSVDSDDQHVEKLAKSDKNDPMVLSGQLNVESCLDQKVLKILSYNVWFHEDLEVYKRMEALGELINQHRPDFVCFQEVTANIYEIFQNSKWWKAYTCSVSPAMATERPYFCMQMSKLAVESFNCSPFTNSIMGRELCLANIKPKSCEALLVATTHLESPCPGPPKWDQMFSNERVSQAKESLAVLNDSPNVIFAGDMNWDDKLDGAFPLLDGWVDAWVVKRPGENGWTYDTKSNLMLSANRTLQKRLDRFLCKLKDFKIDNVEMIGTEPIPDLFYCKKKKLRNKLQELQLPVLPSDHYGLLLTMSSL
ncbi:hypothetical protein HPP92_001591 [Vanilla planifolia]|uniref:RanBP2-type domain-containing protein n=1 Tax=Vanilla planifolia TaxID=51239 RepID=A0A835VH71_VANPL|nr:hypothetical protein HPP92_001591 [Vanilla planifolia]